MAITGRVTGVWREGACVSDPAAASKGADAFPAVAFPVEGLSLEVVEGEQAGQEFSVAGAVESYEAQTPIDATVDEAAQPKTWTAARLWATDAEGRRCMSPIGIDE